MRRESTQFYIPVLLAIAVAAALTWYWFETNRIDPPHVDSSSPPVVEPVAREPEAPFHPFPKVESPERPGGELVALPPLDQSDEYLKLALADVLGSRAVAELLAETDLIAKVVATVDNLPRDHVAERIRPMAGLTTAFGADAVGNNEFTIGSGNFSRYDSLVDMIAGADLDELVELYGRFYPLFQKAYEDLGYPNAHFNDRLVAVVDHLLEAPAVAGPIRVVRPHVLYEYADMDLESLSSGQKLLIRMGNDNARRIKETLRELRTLVAKEDPIQSR